MIVYVESNFVLELAYLQDEHPSCEELLALAGDKNLELVIPAFCLTEPYQTVERRARDRSQLNATLSNELKQLSRSKNYAEHKDAFDAVIGVLVDSIEEQKTSLDSVIRRILAVARIIPTTQAIVWDSVEIKETTKGLSQPDAFVYTSILNDLPGESCFISTDKGLAIPEIELELEKHQCKLLFSFAAGVGYAKRKRS